MKSFRIEKYNGYKKVRGWAQEQNKMYKESVNWKTEQYKSPDMNDKEKMEIKWRPRDVWYLRK